MEKLDNEQTTSPVIWQKGKYTLLRPLELTDAPTLCRGINHPDNSQYLNTIGPLGLGFEEDWIRAKQKPSQEDLTAGVCLHDGTLIGTMGLHHIDLINGTAITGTVIFSPEHRNQGYGSDARMLLLNVAFNRFNLFKVRSQVIAFNTRSVAYSKKCGYTEEGRLRAQHARFGTRYDEILLAVFRDDWLPLWETYQREYAAMRTS